MAHLCRFYYRICGRLFWIGLISFVVLELVYLLVYNAIAKKAEAQKPKEEKEEINFHEYDDDTESDNAQ